MPAADFCTYRSAHLLIRAHGPNAAAQAASVAAALLASGDREGQHIWNRILTTIDRLQGQGRTCGASLH